MSTNAPAHVPDFQNAKDYCAAIAALEASTRAFETQIEAARKLEASNLDIITSTPRPAKSRNLGQHQQQSMLIDALRREIQDGHHTSSEAAQKSIASSLITIDDTLLRHDHNLDLLEKQRNPETGLTNPYGSVEGAEKLMLALRHTQSEIVKTRLDRTYLEALEATNFDVNGYNRDVDSSVHRRIELVKADLEVLHAEINDVSELLVSREHGDVLSATYSSLGDAKRSLRQQESREAAERIGRMREQLEIMTEQAEMLQSHRIVLQRLADHLKHISSVPPAGQPLSAAHIKDDVLRRNTASLAALQQYLGLANAATIRLAKSEQINTAFDALTSHVSTGLAIQKEQESTIRGHSAIPDMASPDSHVVEVPAHFSGLDNLDNEIAVIKARMDSLPL